MKYLSLYKKFVKTGKLENDPNTPTNGGLCSAILPVDRKPFILLFRPDEAPHCYWGYEYEWVGEFENNKEDVLFRFTPLRQNLLLLFAAMNNEL